MSYQLRLPFPKDPEDTEQLTWDFTDKLLTGETINTVEIVEEDSADLTITNVAQADGVAEAYVAGGTADTEYKVACKAFTTNGRIIERTCILVVRER